MSDKHILSRRNFLRTAALVGGGMLVAACGQTAPATAPSGNTPATGQSQPASGTQVVTLRDHMWTGPYDEEFHGAQIKKFEAANPNIKIKSEWFPRTGDEMHKKQIALAASGNLGDNFTYNTAAYSHEYVFKGIPLDLDPVRKADSAWNDTEFKQFWPGNIQNYTIEGKLWGLPQVGHPGDLVEWYNVDMIEKAGAKLPDLNGNWTTDDLLAIAKATTKTGGGTNDVWGLSWAPGVGEWDVQWLRRFGGDFYNQEGTKMLINTPESKEAMNFLADLWHKHKVALPMQPPGTSGANPYLDTFVSGKAAFFHGTTGNMAVVDKQVAGKFRWEATVDPKGPKGHGTQVSSSGYGINKETKNPQQAWTWLKFITSKDYGVERNLSGFSSPGSRFDVWSDPRLIQKYPQFKRIFDAVIAPEPGPRPWHRPANGRYFEANSAAAAIMDNMILGKITANEACAQWDKEIQAILDKPRIS